MNDELKPCPFCGGKAEFDHDDSGYVWIFCKSCGVSTDTDRHNDDDCRVRLASNWNQRAAGASEGQAEPVAWTNDCELDFISHGGATGAIWPKQEEGAEIPLYTHPSAELTALRERIAGMEKDAERLDWLIVNIKRHRLYEHKGHWFCPPVLAQDWQPGHKSARDAIDAAIAKEKQS